MEGRLVGGGDGKPMLGRHMVWAIRRIREKFSLVDERLDTISDVPVLRLTVVANLAALPATAGTNQWFRVTGDPAVYVGNGTGQALRKITTAVL